MAGMIAIAIAAVPDSGRQYYTELMLPLGTSVFEALMASGWMEDPDFVEFWAWAQDNKHSEPRHSAWYVGIFSQKTRLDAPLKSGDRVEIYRPLIIDPMTKRKNLSKKSQKKSTADDQ